MRRAFLLAAIAGALLGAVHAQPADFPFPAERGRIRVDGVVFRTEEGSVWSWRGADCFLCFARVLRGEDVTPQLAWARRHGVNVLRVFGQVNWPGQEDYRRPDRRPDFEAKLRAFFAAAAAAGLRVEYTVLTYPDAIPEMRAQLQRVYDIAASFWNVFVEVANEPDPQGINAAAAIEGVDRRGVVSALGYYDPRVPPGGGETTLRMLDYVTVHTDRLPEWARRSKAARDMRDGYAAQPGLPAFAGAHRPVVGDEPIGAAERDESNRRSTNADDFAAHFAVCALYSAGCTYHFEAGLEGRAPGPDEPIQEKIAQAILAVWQIIPAQVQTCHYTRGRFPDLPVAWTEAQSLRTYGAICGAAAYVVVVRPREGLVLEPAPGWRIAKRQGPVTLLTKQAP